MSLKQWDRQTYALGSDSTSRIHNSNILIEFDQSNSTSCSLLVELTKNLILLGFKSITIIDQQVNSASSGDINHTSFSYLKQWKDFNLELQRLNPECVVSFGSLVDQQVISSLEKFSCIVQCGEVEISILDAEEFKSQLIDPCLIVVGVKGLIGRVAAVSSREEVSAIKKYSSRCLFEGPIFSYLFDSLPNGDDQQRCLAFHTWLNEHVESRNELELFDFIEEKSFENNFDYSDDVSQIKTQIVKVFKEKFTLFEKTREIACYPMISLFSGIASNQILCQILHLNGGSESSNCNHQWFYFDQLHLAPFMVQNTNNIEQETTNNHLVKDLRILIVGAGAIGCELVKNLLAMNVCTGSKGMLHVTDMDSIELTNLNRQFFFTMKDIGKLKSSVLKDMVNNFNPNVNICSYDEKLDDSSKLSSHDFWSTIDIVFGAVDNDQARQYLSNKCNLYSIPFINAGTHAFYSQNSFHLHGKTIPFQSDNLKTEEEKRNEIRTSCTLKSNPEKVEHLIMWSKMKFEDYFSDRQLVEKFLERSQPPVNDSVSGIGSVKHVDVAKYTIARDMFLELFSKYFKENQHCTFENLALDEKYKYYLDENSTFTPRPVRLNFANPIHFSFMNSVMNLLETHFINNGVLPSRGSVSSMPLPFTQLTVEEFNQLEKDSSTLSISSSPHEKKSLQTPFQLLPYEKDDESIVQFIQDCSNIRGDNFNLFGRGLIPERINFSLAKKVAGDIQPALITTTSVSASLQCCHFMQYIQQEQLDSPTNNNYQFIKYNINLEELDVQFEIISSPPMTEPSTSSDKKEIRMKFTNTIQELEAECEKIMPQLDSIYYMTSEGKLKALYHPQLLPETGEANHLESHLSKHINKAQDCVLVELFLSNEECESSVSLFLNNI